MKELTVIFFSSWKFCLTFPVAVYGMHMSFAETIFYTNMGGVIGVIFFSFLSKQLLAFWKRKVLPLIVRKQKYKPVFTKRRRMFISIKNNYGLPGIVFLNPIIFSIPISTFLVNRYFGRKKIYLLWLIAGQIAWSIIYTFFYIYVKKNINF